jgi:hypothetical protein
MPLSAPFTAEKFCLQAAQEPQMRGTGVMAMKPETLKTNFHFQLS